MPLFVFDLIILAVLAFFAWRGAKKGLILSLCSLAGIFLAFFGARFLSQEFAPALSHIIEHELTVAKAEAYIQSLLQPPPPPARKPTYIIRDVRLFLNTVSRGLELIRSAGVDACCQRQDQEDAILLTIRLPKSRRN